MFRDWNEKPGRLPPRARTIMSSTDAADIAESLFKTIDHWGWEIAFERHHEPLSAQTPAARALRELVLGWLAVEHTHADEAENHFRHVYDDPQCGGLAHVG